MRRLQTTTLAALMSMSVPVPEASGQLPDPKPVADIGVDEHLGAEIPADITFVDEQENPVSIGDIAGGERPVVLVLAYYRCPMLCGLVLNGVADTVIGSDLEPGADFDLVTVSFDPEDDPVAAQKRKAPVIAKFEHSDEVEWPYLTGDEANVRRLLDAVGVRVKKDPDSGQYAHPAVFLVLTPKGKISRYLYGFDVRPFDFELAVAEADQGKSGPSVSKLLLRCFSYNPAKRRYGVSIASAFRIGGVVLLFAVGGIVGVLFTWDRRRRRRS